MGGVDWAAIYREHEALLPLVGCRSELNEVLTRMSARLRVLHCFAHPPPPPPNLRTPLPSAALMAKAAPPSFLGARLRAAPDGSGVLITALVSGDPERPEERSPLAAPEFGARAVPGERIAEVNGAPCSTLAALCEALLGQEGKQVRLRLTTASDEP